MGYRGGVVQSLALTLVHSLALGSRRNHAAVRQYRAGVRGFLATGVGLPSTRVGAVQLENHAGQRGKSAMSKLPVLGTPLGYGPKTWVQTERKAHEAWSELTLKSPRAAAVMHRLVAMMGHQNAVVINQKTLAKIMKCSLDTVKRGIRDLEEGNWIQVVQLNGPGTVSGYVVNAAVAWGEARDQIPRLATFHAAVIADADHQATDRLSSPKLRQLPIIYPPEEAIPYGEGEPGSQIALPGFERVIEGKRS